MEEKSCVLNESCIVEILVLLEIESTDFITT
jgi:hypothetical protein